MATRYAGMDGGDRYFGYRDMMRLLWICSTVPPYNSFLFRALSENPGISLRVVVNELAETRHPWKHDLTRGLNLRPIRREAKKAHPRQEERSAIERDQPLPHSGHELSQIFANI